MGSTDLDQYLTRGVERILTGALRASIRNPRQAAFLLRFVPAARIASARRSSSADKGEHTPAFLIASITSRCNLHCAGCYARENASCHDGSSDRNLRADEWHRIFLEAKDMGISFVLLAGGEPFLRPDVLAHAASMPDVLFPVFTNGTIIGSTTVELLDRSRNLVPIISIEGHQRTTDQRRGVGVSQSVETAMRQMREKGIFFGVSVTVSQENLAEVTSDSFLTELRDKGVRLLLYVEYVSLASSAETVPLSDEGRDTLLREARSFREKYDEILVLTFPGDELASGGCLAAGRGFIHINPEGGAEPCPFSPYSDANVREMTLRAALDSGFFRKIRDAGFLQGAHAGGCVLVEHDQEVRALREENA